MNRNRIAAAALAVAVLVTGCADNPATSNENTVSNDNPSLLETGAGTGSVGNVPADECFALVCSSGSGGSVGNAPPTPGTPTGSGGSGGVIAPTNKFNLLDCTETDPCAGSGGNVPPTPVRFDGTGGSGGVVNN